MIPTGAGIVEDSWVEKLNDYNDFTFQLKTTGGYFNGDMLTIKRYWDDINNR